MGKIYAPLCSGTELSLARRRALCAAAIPPVAGAFTPDMTLAVTALSVEGNTAITVPLFAALVVVAAPGTVKKFALTPSKVYPALAVRVIAAVYTVFAAKVPPAGCGVQLTAPVNCAVSVIVTATVPPVAGAVKPDMTLAVTALSLEPPPLSGGLGQPLEANIVASSKPVIPVKTTLYFIVTPSILMGFCVSACMIFCTGDRICLKDMILWYYNHVNRTIVRNSLFLSIRL